LEAGSSEFFAEYPQANLTCVQLSL
jgi:hypothetical protein